jgi:small subunit ribosomal protein S17
MAVTTAPEKATVRPLRKVRVGEVVSNKMDKTIVVRTITRVPHPKFGKITKLVAKFHAHDEKNEAQIGDRVSIMETRPLSKTKRWRLVEILKH